MESQSPVVVKDEPKEKEMDFAEAIKEILEGKKVTKLEWDDPKTYLALQGGHLQIHKSKGTDHDLIVSEGDMRGEDWVLVP